MNHMPGLMVMALLVLVIAGGQSKASESVVASTMAGHWEGSARIIVSWCVQTNLPVSVDIHQDGSVSGKVGDAALQKGRLKRNRGWLGRNLNLATDYIIVGDLAGPIVAAEGINRDHVSIPLNFRTNTFVGGVHTSGSMFGGKQKMKLSASSLVLRQRVGAASR